MEIIFCLISVLVCSIIFATVGSTVLSFISYNKNKQIAFNFYIGQIVCIVLFSLLALYITTITITTFLILIIGLLCGIYTIYNKNFSIVPTKKEILLCTISLIAIAIVVFTYYNIPTVHNIDKWAFNGSIHTGRSENIITYFTTQNKLSPVGQNFGQVCLLLFSQSIYKCNLPIAISIWLIVNGCFFVLLIFNFLKKYIASNSIVYKSILLIMLGATNIGLVLSNIIDIGSPFILSGYTDNYQSLSTLLLIFYLLYSKHIVSHKFNTIGYYLLITTLLVANHIFGIQNFVALLSISGIGVIYLFFYKKKKLLLSILPTIILLLLIVGIGKWYSGMLVQQKYINQAIPDTISVYDTKHTGITILPAISHKYYVNKEYEFNQVQVIPKADSVLAASNTPNKLRVYATILEANLWDALRLLFYPIMVTIIGVWYCTKYKADAILLLVTLCSIAFFCSSFILAFCFKVNDYKLELNRFFYSFILFAFINWGLLYQYSHHTKVKQLLHILMYAALVPLCVDLVLRWLNAN